MKKLAVILGLFLNTQCSDQFRNALEGFGGQQSDQATLGVAGNQSNLDFERWPNFDLDTFFVVQSQSQSINQAPVAQAAAAAAGPENEGNFFNLPIDRQQGQQYYPYISGQKVSQQDKETQTNEYSENLGDKEKQIDEYSKNSEGKKRKKKQQKLSRQDIEKMKQELLALRLENEQLLREKKDFFSEQCDEKKEKYRISASICRLKKLFLLESKNAELAAKECYKNFYNYFGESFFKKSANRYINKERKGKDKEFYQIGVFYSRFFNKVKSQKVRKSFLLKVDEYVQKKETIPTEEEMKEMFNQAEKSNKNDEEDEEESEQEESDEDGQKEGKWEEYDIE